MMKFRTAFDPAAVVPNATGDGKENEYKMTNDPETGDYTLVVSHRVSVYDRIQDQAPAHDISEIMARHAGDIEIPAVVFDDGVVDLTGAPASYSEAFDKLQKGAEAFGRLPTKVKEHYGQNQANFLRALASGDFVRDFGEKVTVSEPASALGATVAKSEPSSAT